MGAKTKVDENMIIQINELYLVHKTYAAVARIIGLAPSTVKKYIKKDFVPREDLVVTKCNIEDLRLKIKSTFLTKEELSDPLLLILSQQEQEDLKELRKEILI